MPDTDLQDLQARVRFELQDLGIVPLDRRLDRERTGGGKSLIASLRRRNGRRRPDPVTSFSVVEDDGAVRFVPGAFLPYPSGRRGRRGPQTGRKVDDFKFENLAPNQVQLLLQKTDTLIRERNSKPEYGYGEQEYGLREWDAFNGTFRPVDPAKKAAKGRILLIVHGFISSTNHLLREMRGIDVAGVRPGEQFLCDLIKSGRYKQVLTFDHRTISVSPVLNALELQRELVAKVGHPGDGIDVICHSRGGLVTRWWLEGLGGLPGTDPRPPRVIFLGSPLAGTSLAAPARLRAVMDLFSSIGSFFGKAADAGAQAVPFAAPFLLVAGTLFKVFSYVTKAVAKTPIIDAGINMVAGISGMSRVGNNPELLHLRGYDRRAAPPDYFAVRGNFRPPNEGWRFWRYFYNVGERAKSLFMDQVFDEENDLIVNTASMTQLGRGPNQTDEETIADGVVGGVRVTRVLEYTGGTVHHTNYFSQPNTIKFFRENLIDNR